MNRPLTLCLTAAVAVAGLGCEQPFSNDDIRFLKALPTRDQLRLEVPADHAGRGLRPTELGQPAEFHRQAFGISSELNEGALAPLDLIAAITEHPPTERQENLRVWGPWIDGDNRFQLIMNRTSTQTEVRPVSGRPAVSIGEAFTYVLRASKLADETWVPIVSGAFVPTDGISSGIGHVLFSFEAARRFDPSARERGVFAVGYDTRAGLALELVADDMDGPDLFEEPEAYYRYVEEPDGRVDFRFASRANIHDEPDLIAEEVLVIHARWQADGQGRADVVVAEGDLETPLLASECWDARFLRVFFWASMFLPLEGRLEACHPELRVAEFPTDM